MWAIATCVVLTPWYVALYHHYAPTPPFLAGVLVDAPWLALVAALAAPAVEAFVILGNRHRAARINGMIASIALGVALPMLYLYAMQTWVDASLLAHH